MLNFRIPALVELVLRVSLIETNHCSCREQTHPFDPTWHIDSRIFHSRHQKIAVDLEVVVPVFLVAA